MNNQLKINHSAGAYPKSFDVFSVPVTDVATAKKDYLIVSSKNPLDDMRLFFPIDGIRNQLIAIHELKLYIKGKLVMEDGSPIIALPSGDWAPTALTGDSNKAAETARAAKHEKMMKADVFLVNHLYSSLFKDATMFIQNSKMHLNDYAYRGIIDVYTKNSFNGNKPVMSEFYVPPSKKAKKGESIITTHSNPSDDGFLFYNYTKESNEIEMCGDLLFPLCQQKKLMISHVGIQIELLKHYPEFYLRHPHDKYRYKFVVTDCRLEVPLITLPPDVEIAQAEVLKTNPALYVYNNKTVTTHSVATGSYHFNDNNTWNGDVPTKLTILMLPSENYNGTLKTDPFAFEHNFVNYASVTVDDSSVGGNAKQLQILSDERKSKIIDAYCSIVENFPEMELTRKRWIENFPALYFNINSSHTEDSLPLIRKGLTKVSLKFDQPLAHDTIVLMLAEFPAVLEIDGTRNVSL